MNFAKFHCTKIMQPHFYMQACLNMKFQKEFYCNSNQESIDLTKDVQDLHEENYKNVLNDIKDLNKQRQDRKSQYQKDAYSSQNLYGFKQ